MMNNYTFFNKFLNKFGPILIIPFLFPVCRALPSNYLQTGHLSLPSTTVTKVVHQLDKLLANDVTKKFIFGTWKRMQPTIFLSSGHNSVQGRNVLLTLLPLVHASEVIFKSHWPDLYQTYSNFPLDQQSRVGIWPQAQFLKNMHADWHKDSFNWHGGIQISLVFGSFFMGSVELESGKQIQFSGKEDECSFFIFNPWEVRHRVIPSTGTRYSLQLFAHYEVVKDFINKV
jgi:hypothetical protein